MKTIELKYDNFEQFLSSDELNFLRNSGFIYRGEGKDNYILLPSVLRKENETKLYQLSKLGSPLLCQRDTEELQRGAEFSLLQDFYLKANYNGLKIPRSELLIKSEQLGIQNITSAFNSSKWIPKDLEETAALAQHYGVMTRLLDWTFNYNVAVYFASINALKDICNGTNTKYIVLWALNYRQIEETSNGLKALKSELFPLNFVIPPYNENKNLNAQKGILSYWQSSITTLSERSKKDDDFSLTPIDRSPLDVLIEKATNKLEKDAPSLREKQPYLFKIKILSSEALKMLNYVKSNGYTTASIFPGYDGVAKECAEQEVIKKAREKLKEKSRIKKP